MARSGVRRETYRRHGRTYEVWRDEGTGEFAMAPGDTRRYHELLRWARRQRDMEDRTGPVLRFGEDTNGWWYMPAGNGVARWRRRGDRPQWVGDWYYHPRTWTPVVPPRAEWEARNPGRRWPYHGPTGTGLSPGRDANDFPGPPQLRDAAHLFASDRAGRASPGETTARSDAWSRIMQFVGLRDEEPRSRRRVAKVARSSRTGTKRARR